MAHFLITSCKYSGFWYRPQIYSYINRQVFISQKQKLITYTFTYHIMLIVIGWNLLQAAVEYGEELPEDEQRDIISDWMLRVESAADTIIHLKSSLTDFEEHVETPQGSSLCFSC